MTNERQLNAKRKLLALIDCRPDNHALFFDSPSSHRVVACVRQRSSRERFSAKCRPVRRWTCQNREQRILGDCHAQPLPLAFSASLTAPTK